MARSQNLRSPLAELAVEISACRVCVECPKGRPLPHEPRPVFQISETARVCIVSQAPGTRVHASGRPFTDPSGDRLRSWLGVDSATFYDASQIVIAPMGFCFPGLDAKGGDLPPRRECAPLWHERLLAAMPQIELVLAVGSYALAWHVGGGQNLTETVADWRAVLARSGGPMVLPLPHPSWRNNAWIKKNPWFEADLLPVVRREVRKRLHR